MKKPSIFSREYERKMKRRKKIFFIGIVLLIICSFGFLIFGKLSNTNTIFKNIAMFFKNDKTLEKKEKESVDSKKINEDSKIDEENKLNNVETEEDKNKDILNEEKTFDITLQNGTVSKAIYKEENGIKKYEMVSPIEGDNTFDISKSKESLLLNNSLSGDIKLYTNDINPKVLNQATYNTRDGRTFTKESIINANPGYKWCQNAKFLSDSKIVYLSNLPWFGKKELDTYLWVVDIGTNTHRALMNIKGKNIILGSQEDKGLQINIDGVQKYLTNEEILVD